MAESAALLPRSGGTLSLAQWCHLFFFMVSGVATPLLVGFVKRQGACGVRTMFSVFPNYVVMIFTVCGNWRARGRGTVRWRAVAGATVVDAVSQGANYTGLLLAGSGTYIVIYSSVTLWVAVLSRAVLGKRQSAAQWLGCALVSVGVAATGLNAAGTGPSVAAGVALVALGSVGHSLAYVLMEWNTRVADDPICPERLASLMGAGGAALYAVYEAAAVAPRWRALVTESVAEAGGQPRLIAAGYAALLLAFWAHAFTFYNLMTTVGATAAGVCKGLQAVGVLAMSHLLYCEPGGAAEARAQCFNGLKGAAFALVFAGVLLFSSRPSAPPPRPPPPRVKYAAISASRSIEF